MLVESICKKIKDRKYSLAFTDCCTYQDYCKQMIDLCGDDEEFRFYYISERTKAEAIKNKLRQLINEQKLATIEESKNRVKLPVKKPTADANTSMSLSSKYSVGGDIMTLAEQSEVSDFADDSLPEGFWWSRKKSLTEIIRERKK